MAIGAITMILTNVGLQIYNNWCGSRQNSKLQKKREEFERAARDRNTEHMWKLLHEGQELTMQLEKEKHDDRLKELKEEVDNLLERLTYEATINNWPLKVLPIVMKNQAFGNLLANQEENVAMHVIFTRSNYDKFNKLVYPVVEKQLEQYCDKHWSIATDHPVLFYSGAWKPMSSPTDVQVSAMREELKNLPTLLISPFFRPEDGKLVFQVYMWGVGPNSYDQFNIAEIEPKSDEFHFQRTYTNKQDYENEMGLLDETVEDLVPYLQCMIGYMADTYFWSSAGLAPHLPLLVTNGAINTDGMKYLVDDSREYYDQLLLESEENAKKNPFMQQNLLNLYEGSAELWDEETRKRNIENIFITFCATKTGKNIYTIEDAVRNFSLLNYDTANAKFLTEIGGKFSDEDRKKTINDLIERLQCDNPNLTFCFTASQKELQIKIKENNKLSRRNFAFKILSPNTILGAYCNGTEDINYCSCYVFSCIDPMGLNSGTYISRINDFKAAKMPIDVLSKIKVNKEAAESYYIQKRNDFVKFIQLYDELSSKTGIESLRWQENLYFSKDDIVKWVNSNTSEMFTAISFFKGYSKKWKKYLLFGVFRKGNDLQLGQNVLVSYYDTMPPAIEQLFSNNTQFILKFN